MIYDCKKEAWIRVFIFVDSGGWYGEVCLQRGGIKFGHLSHGCCEDEQFNSG